MAIIASRVPDLHHAKNVFPVSNLSLIMFLVVGFPIAVLYTFPENIPVAWLATLLAI